MNLLMRIHYLDLNTSNVTIQRGALRGNLPHVAYLNTSNVTIQRIAFYVSEKEG